MYRLSQAAAKKMAKKNNAKRSQPDSGIKEGN
jgi:hypothetical protein